MEQNTQTQAEPTKKSSPQSGEEFFSGINPEADLEKFVGHMKQPREEVPPPDFDPFEEQEEGDGLPSEEEKKLFQELNAATDEHKKLAEFLLVQLDKVLAFTLSLVSTMDADRYRRRKTKPAGEDYEADLLAALLKKYQMRMSLEYMFVSALAIAYFPAVSMAVKDRKIAEEERRLQARKQELELMQEMVGKSAPKEKPEKTKEE